MTHSALEETHIRVGASSHFGRHPGRCPDGVIVDFLAAGRLRQGSVKVDQFDLEKKKRWERMEARKENKTWNFRIASPANGHKWK